jgi:uncharacterized protein YqeY
MLEKQIERDLKTALLAGDQLRVTLLRSLKSVLLNTKVEQGSRGQELDDETVLRLLTKESKKRQESADLYQQGGSPERAEAELSEKAVIDSYLPEQLSEQAVTKLIDEVIKDLAVSGPQAMGQVVGEVKSRSKGAADGALIARLTKERLTK